MSWVYRPALDGVRTLAVYLVAQQFVRQRYACGIAVYKQRFTAPHHPSGGAALKR